MFEDIEEAIRSCKLKDRQLNDQRENNDVQNNAQETKDLATRTPLKVWSRHNLTHKVLSDNTSTKRVFCRVRVIVFNATFNKISGISWRSVLFAFLYIKKNSKIRCKGYGV